MATHDYVLDNATGANFRADLNNALAAIVSNNSSSTEPSTKYAYQWWADTNEGVLKIRNSANDGWITLLQLDGTLTLEDGSNSAPALGFRDDLDTGIFSSAANTLDVTCGGTTRGSFSSSGLSVTGNVTATTFVGNIDAVDGDFDGTLEADAITVAGTALSTVIEGSTLTQAAQTNITSLGTLTGLTLSGDMTFTGDSANIVFDKSDSQFEFADNAKAEFGTGGDFEIFHNGTQNIIGNTATQVRIITDQLRLRSSSGSETYAQANVNSAFEANFDNSKKFETTSTGVAITGGLTASGSSTFNEDVFFIGASSKTITFDQSEGHIRYLDNAKAQFGTGGDLEIFHDGNNSRIEDQGTGYLAIRSNNVRFENPAANEAMLYVQQDGAVQLYYDNSKKFESTSSGVEVFGQLQMDDGNSHIKLIDGARIDIGSSADLQIFHSGGENFIRGNASASTLFIDCCNELQIRHLDTDGTNSEKMILCNDDGSVELYHNNSKKIETTSSGIDVTGAITVNGSALSTGGGKILQVVQGTLDGTFSTTSTSFVNIGLSAAITPAATSSKILVLAMINFGSDNNGNRIIIRLVRTGDDNILAGTGSGSRTRASAQYATTDDGDMNNVNLTHLDSPSTTSSTTYQVQCKVQSSSGTAKFGASGGDGNSSIEARTPQRIVLLEVGA